MLVPRRLKDNFRYTHDMSSLIGPASATATDRVYAVLRRLIHESHFQPGESLIEASIAEELEVSRTPVRSALLRLALEGLVDVIPNRGAFVTSWSNNQIEEIFDIRIAVEPLSAALAASRISPDELRELGRLCDEMDAALERGRSGGDYVAQATDLNAAFHRVIIEASRDRQIRAFLTAVIEFPLMHRTVAAFPLTRLGHAWDEHREIVRALAAGDADLAAATMCTHILAARALSRQPADAAVYARV